MSFYQITEEKILHPGHAACPGCPQGLAFRYIANTLGQNTVGVVPPSCGAIITGFQPLSGLTIPIYSTAFEASAVSAAGIKRALKAKGLDHVTVLVIAGDGGTYDIGLQSLSGAAERNEDILYVCIDNEGYMNTGNQKSSATPLYAYSSSTPMGKNNGKKNLVEIMTAHRIPYLATATVGYLDDMINKINKAKKIKGFRFILILSPCLDGWGLPDDAAVKFSRLAVDTGVFPLYEVENGTTYTVNHGSKGIPVAAYLKPQRRYRHLAQEQIEEIQRQVDQDWERVEARWTRDQPAPRSF